jgi:hypothetical protein
MADSRQSTSSEAVIQEEALPGWLRVSRSRNSGAAGFGVPAERGARAMTNRSVGAAVLAAAAVIITAASAAAQVTTGTIVGTVSDINGVVPGAF